MGTPVTPYSRDFRQSASTLVLNPSYPYLRETTAEYLASRGAKLVLGARGVDKLDEVCRRLVGAGGEAECVAIDVARCEGVAMVARSQERFGRFDVLINNAGVMPILQAR